MARPLAEGPELEVSGASRAKQVAATFRKRKRKCPAQALGWAGFPVCPLRHRKRRGARGRPSECEPAGGVAGGWVPAGCGLPGGPTGWLACRLSHRAVGRRPWAGSCFDARVPGTWRRAEAWALGRPLRRRMVGDGGSWSLRTCPPWSRLPEVLTPRTSLLGPSVWRGVWKRGLPPKAPRSAGSDLRAVQAPGAS